MQFYECHSVGTLIFGNGDQAFSPRKKVGAFRIMPLPIHVCKLTVFDFKFDGRLLDGRP